MDARTNLISPWRKSILHRLRKRDDFENRYISSIIDSHRRISQQLEQQRATNLELQGSVQALKKENLEMQIKADSGIDSSNQKPGDKVSALEKKVVKLLEELTDLHRSRGENAQTIINLNQRVKELEKEVQAKEDELLQTAIKANAYGDEIKNLEKAILEAENANTALRDEQQALQLMCSKQEETLRKVSQENAELINRWMQEKAKDADLINKNNAIVQDQLREKHRQASTQSRSRTTSTSSLTVSVSPPVGAAFGTTNFCLGASIPDKCLTSIEAHDSEVNTVRFCPSGSMFTTAGNDRKVKVWGISTNQFINKGTLLGSNAGVTSIDFDVQEQFVLGASNDFAIRVWGMHDHRLRHTLTGHSGKVLAARFLSDPNKIVSGSHDRTLKIWDLRNRACTKTIFAGSSCNDLVTTDGAGTNIISGHFDKKIRFWDIRADSGTSDIHLQGRITSLDLSQTDRTLLLCCTKDDRLQLIDLRMNKILQTCSADGFKVFFDFTRAALSPDAAYATAGSQDGSVYTWSVKTGELEKVLKEHEVPVIAVSWHPNGRQMLSCDRSKKVVLWADL
ncbi:Autophagy-related protein 16-1 [Holothuria leucospilota]|uniref:Autophagy-related protein 16-1 n=1 Tax=Holothuria leucospilota TaxID=206669 RepID=A0A9Q1BQB7_HOLLE|nr:Autophagy-related protein 16-1 [Holothuria leucospilota]